MITKTDAIAIGKALVAGMKHECEVVATIHNDERRWAARGAIIRALENLWCDVLPIPVREKFNYNNREFFAAVGFE